jgi:DNA-binding GntR family transcriptional regulator
MEATATSQPQRAVTRADTLRAELEALIVDGRLRPGARLDENELANRFGVSRTPVREAIKVLVAIGLAEMRGRQGASVAMPSISTLLEMFEMMAMLEGMCAGFAARRSTAAERARLRELHAELVEACEAGEPERFYQINARFHDTIYGASHTAFVSEQTWQLRRRLAPYRLQVTYQPERMSGTLSEHMRIIEAIEAADAKAATEAASDHVRLLGDNLSDFIAAIQDGFLHQRGEG